MKIRHATLLDVIGRPAKMNGCTIVPARLEFDGTEKVVSRLADLAPDRIPPILRLPIAKGFDAAWVRGRLPMIFGFTPEPAEVEKTLLLENFIAIFDGSNEGIAFECSDYYGKTV